MTVDLWLYAAALTATAVVAVVAWQAARTRRVGRHARQVSPDVLWTVVLTVAVVAAFTIANLYGRTLT